MPNYSPPQEKRYHLYICLDPVRPGLRCEVRADPGDVLGEIAVQAVGELLINYAERLPGVTAQSVSSWAFMHGEFGEETERLDAGRTFHDLAIFPGETIYLGPSRCFENRSGTGVPPVSSERKL